MTQVYVPTWNIDGHLKSTFSKWPGTQRVNREVGNV